MSGFAAIKNDGSVVTWNSGVTSDIMARLQGGITTIQSTAYAFAALNAGGGVVTWGSAFYGGDSRSVEAQITSGVIKLFSNNAAFAALKNDGSVITWGDSTTGGDSGAVAADLQDGIVEIFASEGAFAAIKQDGRVVTWGVGQQGGDSRSVADLLLANVVKVFSNGLAFAALKNNGSVVTWGDRVLGANSDAVRSELQSGVVDIVANRNAFAARKADGSVVVWGSGREGGGLDASKKSDLSSGVVSIFSTGGAFAALKDDGSVVVWGDSYYGGDSSFVSRDLEAGVVAIFSTFQAFSALKDDGSVVSWGEVYSGGDSFGVSSKLQGDVVTLSSAIFQSTVGIVAAPHTILEGRNGNTTCEFVLSRYGDVSQESVISWEIQPGGITPANNMDFVNQELPFGFLTFAAGERTKSVIVLVQGDITAEPDETFVLKISNVSAGTSILSRNREVIILNDDFVSQANISQVTNLLSSPTLSFLGTPDMVTLPSAASTVAHTMTPEHGVAVVDGFTVDVDTLVIDLAGAANTDLVGFDTTLNGQHAIALANKYNLGQGVVLANMPNDVTATDLFANHVIFSGGKAYIG